MAHYLCKLDLSDAELVNTEEQRIEDRRSDLVAKVQTRQGDEFILHIEVQNSNDAQMVSRMLHYLSDIQLAYPGCPVYQCLIYTGSDRLAMAGGQTGKQLNYRYQLVDMRSIGYRVLFDQGTPEALVLSILCDFQGESATQIVRHILQKLEALIGTNDKARREYLEMLEILADNRQLNIDIQEAYEMLQINIERLPSYVKGMEKGIEKGIEKGMEKGSENEAKMLLQRALHKRFGNRMEPILQAKIDQASLAEIEVWFDRVFDATSLENVFKEPD
ncbi:MAG: hypothetical protein KJ725_19805 [Gammaproteobacteria bacterium]|nr:hypothetical protein [Gammaproteobacteria bacterium]